MTGVPVPIPGEAVEKVTRLLWNLLVTGPASSERATEVGQQIAVVFLTAAAPLIAAAELERLAAENDRTCAAGRAADGEAGGEPTCGCAATSDWLRARVAELEDTARRPDPTQPT